jgi:hypothetical protein
MQKVDNKEQVILKRDEYIDGYHVLVFNDFDSLCVLFNQMIQSRPSNAMPCYASQSFKSTSTGYRYRFKIQCSLNLPNRGQGCFFAPVSLIVQNSKYANLKRLIKSPANTE